MDSALKSRPAEGKNVDAIVVVQIMCVGIQVTAEQRVLLANCIIDPADSRVFVVGDSPVKPDLAACVLRGGKAARKVQCRRREQRLVDAVDRVAAGIGSGTLDWS